MSRLSELRGIIGSAWRRFGATLLLGAVAVVLFAWPGASEAVQLDRAGVGDGQWWRAITGHWTHWNAEHLFWDVLVFTILAGAAERASRAWMLTVVAASAVTITFAVLLFAPEIVTYRGLSGIDSALFVALAIRWLAARLRDRERVGAVVMAGALVAFVGKTLYETTTGTTLFVDTSSGEMIPVALAHLGGALVGVLTGLAAAAGDSDRDFRCDESAGTFDPDVRPERPARPHARQPGLPALRRVRRPMGPRKPDGPERAVAH